MKASVRKVNYKRGWVVFEEEDGDFGWFEILDTMELEEDDLLQGNFEILGETSIIKVDTGESIDIFIEDYGMSYKNAVGIVFRK